MAGWINSEVLKSIAFSLENNRFFARIVELELQGENLRKESVVPRIYMKLDPSSDI